MAALTAAAIAIPGGETMAYQISDDCISCGACVEACPQRAITLGAPSVIHQEHCLHCGNCVEHCPVAAVIPREQETVPPET